MQHTAVKWVAYPRTHRRLGFQRGRRLVLDPLNSDTAIKHSSPPSLPSRSLALPLADREGMNTPGQALQLANWSIAVKIDEICGPVQHRAMGWG